MSQLITVKLARPDGTPWGFRLQGGKDFGTPLVIQKVNGGSPAEKAGLISGDSVVKVNNVDVYNLRHKDAQDVIVKGGQAFEMTIQRGGSTWKPAVTPVGSIPRSQPVANNVSPVTKTSLAAKKQDYTPIGAAHNMSPKGFNTPHLNGSSDGPKLVNKQYNSPMALYSEQSIAETLSAQAEVLSTGAMGVNFKKNEKNYNAANSEVYKMLQEAENEPKTPEPASDSVVSGGVSPAPTGLRHVVAPEYKPPASTPQLPPGQNICADCERLIVGVFVRIKDKNLHVECFKCATCGASLKNVGYYNINNKLYCDIHAKLAAKSSAPAPNMVPITIPPGGKVPASAISSALSSHSMPSPSPLSPSGNLPAPFQSLDSNTLFKDHTVANLSAALTMARIKEYKESGTNTEPENLRDIYKTALPSNQEVILARTDHNNSNAHVQYVPFTSKTGVSLSGPKPFSSVQPSAPTHAPVTSPLSNTLPKSVSSAAMPGRFSAVKSPPSAREHVNEEITSNTTNRNCEEPETLMTAVTSEIYIPVSDYNSTPKFNSVDLRVPIHVVRDKFNSPDQEVFQINTSRSVDNSPVQFDGNLKNFIAHQLDNRNVINDSKKDSKEILPGQFNIDSVDSNINAISYAKKKNGIRLSNVNELGYSGAEYPVCVDCKNEIRRGPFITALGKIWCPEHFVCTTPSCRRPLQDMGFVEERGQLYCEFCFEQYLAPTCSKCNTKIKGDCLNAVGKHFHPECFACAYCSKLFGNSPFFLEDGLPYCEADWNELFTTKCFACGFPVEAGDRWVEALNNNYHSQCFNCTMCKKNLEGQSFYAKGGRPFCKNHAR